MKNALIITVALVLLAGCYQRRSEYYYYNKGNLYLTKDKLEAALDVYREVLERNPYHAGAHNNLGVVYMRKHLYSEAITEFERAIELDDNYREAYNNLAVAYKEMKMFGEALAAAEKALLVDPNYLLAYRTLAQIHFDSEDYEQAEKYFRQVLKSGREGATLHIQLGLIYQRSGRMEDAIAQYRRAVDLAREKISGKDVWLVWYLFPSHT